MYNHHPRVDRKISPKKNLKLSNIWLELTGGFCSSLRVSVWVFLRDMCLAPMSTNFWLQQMIFSLNWLIRLRELQRVTSKFLNQLLDDICLRFSWNSWTNVASMFRFLNNTRNEISIHFMRIVLMIPMKSIEAKTSRICHKCFFPEDFRFLS